MIDKADANFVGGLTFNKIGDTGIYIGPYPQTHDDAKALYSAGVTGVLNVQTEIDHAHRSIDWSKMQAYYRELNIEPFWFPIHDFNATDLESKIYEGAQKLNEMLTRELKVYVHCTAGMGRAPAVVLTYLSIFKDMDPTIADLFVKSYRSVSAPNLPVVKRVAEKYGK
ncbi:hypothetical protein FGO68_gene572 [Halteria grandinella]|uniref:Dual specificity protein phosphatase n=1 Tax=Halteria grandinella TaxID=5974 RepID=A0A8J8NTP6_HALGN|nr:hypothetical protein FGO68_gene572 [Halteria grandinella]